MVVGGGVAGLVAALTAAPRARVLVVSKGATDDGCTAAAQGGIAAAVGPDDSPELHFDDTMAAGRGLCDERAVRLMVEDAPTRVAQLAAWGVAFDRDGEGVDLHREAAHSRARVLHSGGDATGAAIEAALLRRLHESPVTVLEGQVVTHLVQDGAGRIGVELCDPTSGERARVTAGAVILATGGASALWRHTTNPGGATGDGIALAFEAGADVADVEFIQFHPTVLALAGAPAFLISEAVRGEGGLVVDAGGRRFLQDADPRGELAPRDIVARSIWDEMARSGSPSVFLDCRGVGARLVERFPTIVATCRSHGIDPVERPIPIAPAAHYTIGGVVTDLDGATTVPGLYACGEVARTGVHGANRLASNSLLEGAVFGRRAAEAAVAGLASRPAGVVAELPMMAVETRLADLAAEQELRELMWSACGISRTGPALAAARAEIARMGEEAGEGTARLAQRRARLARTAARLIVGAALHREESRGAHHRGDFPTSIDRWRVSHVMRDKRGVEVVHDPAAHH
ncbi:MAG: L-aspartate oxidase [Candidatus Dormibacteria bacterium]